ncbi:MAG TPA: TIGR01777 family oxidoreductase [Ignavibacteriales bacterium]|nr:TIGR01777 family oxidoreductase [Ignavibacteriales bacterium]
MAKKVAVTGATGLIGRHIFKALLERGDEVTVLSRSPGHAKEILPGAHSYVKWDSEKGAEGPGFAGGLDAVVHLAAAPVMDKRWNESYKEKILKSRQDGTRILVNELRQSTSRPEALVSASAIGYYGVSRQKAMTEEDHPGMDFLAEVCKLWEEEAARSEEYGIRNVRLRLGIVLDARGGALKKMLTPFKFFIGGPLGRGSQGFSWVHIDDVVNVFLMAIDNRSMRGAYNLTSPEPVSMKEFSDKIGRAVKRPSWLKVPEFALDIVVGEGAYTITNAPVVLPERLKEMGYKFKFSESLEALRDIIRNRE